MNAVTINIEMALNRFRTEAPQHLVSLEDAYYILYGEVIPKSLLLRAWQMFDRVVFEHIKAAYYLLSINLQDFFSNDSSVDYIEPEDAPPGTKKGDVLFEASEVALYLRRARCEMYHPSLGIKLATYNFGHGEVRIDPSDLQRFLLGESAVADWPAAIHSLNGPSLRTRKQ
jgi:hypothetical protein